ncbi:MAG: hypothetical protein QGF09_13005 [Rhodospirillales bacterium]|nr:hypothetical protein [Rhodospirillales bacterium]
MSKIRVLPITIFAAVLMLSVKIGDIVDGVSGKVDGLPIAQANAQEPPKAPAPQPAPPQGAQPPAAQPPAAQAPGDQADGKKDAAKDGAKGKDGKAANTQQASTSRSALDDPTLFTQSEIDLLQQLADRREILEARGQELDRREVMLSAAEKRINKKIEEMRGLEGSIKKLIKTHTGQQDDQMKSLVKIYENMKPKDAARIFEELDLPTLLKVAERMSERKLAPVMAQMAPAKAKEVTVELSKLRRLPEPGSPAGG